MICSWGGGLTLEHVVVIVGVDFLIVQTVKTAQELRRPIYRGIASRAVSFDQVHTCTGCVYCGHIVKWNKKIYN